MKKLLKLLKNIISEKKFLKSCLCFLGINIISYWSIKLFQNSPAGIHFSLDDKIPFIGQFVYIYNMFYPFCFIALYFLYKKDKNAYYKALFSSLIGIFICDLIYLISPTIMYRPPLPNTDPITTFVLKITFYFDNPPMNCFPSIHCLFCFQIIYSYIFSKTSKKQRKIAIAVSSLIILSTLFVKQHYIFDMISALTITIITNLITELFHFDHIINKKVNSKK